MIQQGLTNSFKQEMLQAGQDLATDTLKMALYTAFSDIAPLTTVYTTTNQVNYVPLIQGIFPKKSATYLYYQPRNWHFPSSVEKVFMGQINTIIPLVFLNFLYFFIYLKYSHCTTIF